MGADSPLTRRSLTHCCTILSSAVLLSCLVSIIHRVKTCSISSQLGEMDFIAVNRAGVSFITESRLLWEGSLFSLPHVHWLLYSNTTCVCALRNSTPTVRLSFLPTTPSPHGSCLVLLCCKVCKEQDRRYCCPRCGKLTCSLACCVRHKREV